MSRVIDHPDLDEITERLLAGQRGADIVGWLRVNGKPPLRRKQINDYYRRHLSHRHVVSAPSPKPPAGAKILAIDIETSPALVYVWGLWDQNVSLQQIVDDTRVICFAAKWLGQDEIMFHSEYHDGHSSMIKKAHELLNQADVVLHYNGTRFDVPHLQREFLEYGLPPTSSFLEIDLLVTAKRKFKFLSNKLQNVSKKIGLEGKIENDGFKLWRDCLAGDAAAWNKMRKYNEQDVLLLEEAYEILRPWVPIHPNLSLISGDLSEAACPRCGGHSLQKRGMKYTSASAFQQYFCTSCNGWSRSAKRESTNSNRNI